MAGGVTFEWSIDGDYMDITLKSQETGWVAVGFNPSFIMENADFYIGYVKDGQAYLRDDYGNRRTSHSADTTLGGTEDFTNLMGEETSQGTVISFRIPLDSGDSKDHKFVSGQEIPVLFAFSRKDNFTSIHSGKGKAMISFDW